MAYSWRKTGILKLIIMKQKKRKSGFLSSKINPKGFHISQWKFYAFLLPMSMFMILPIVFIFNHAFKPVEELFFWPPRFFVRRPTLRSFENLISLTTDTHIPVSRYLFNTFVVTVIAILITLVISVAAGYALSKKDFRVKNILFQINTLALMFVPIAVTVPRYMIIVNLGLIDSFAVNILPLVVSPVSVFLIKQFVDTNVPDSLVEAARIDGASDLYILWKVVLPLVTPALATVTIMVFQSSWAYTEASVMFINNESYRTFAYFITTFVTTGGGMHVATAGVAAASTLIMFIPNLIIFIFMQSRIINTMAHSGIK